MVILFYFEGNHLWLANWTWSSQRRKWNNSYNTTNLILIRCEIFRTKEYQNLWNESIKWQNLSATTARTQRYNTLGKENENTAAVCSGTQCVLFICHSHKKGRWMSAWEVGTTLAYAILNRHFGFINDRKAVEERLLEHSFLCCCMQKAHHTSILVMCMCVWVSFSPVVPNGEESRRCEIWCM